MAAPVSPNFSIAGNNKGAPRGRPRYLGTDGRTVNLEIHKPELVERVNAQIRRRHLNGAYELIEKALDAQPARPRTGQDLIDACAKVRGLLTDEEIDTIFSRHKSAARPVDF
jgi:hypothetical protein